jgi:serine/threonine-protein kinase ATR
MAGRLTGLTGIVSNGTLLCHVCDCEQREHDVDSNRECTGIDDLCKILAYIIPRLTRTPSLRITAMTTLKRTMLHAPNSTYSQLISSVFGEFCLQSLRSSIRELRVVTGYGLYALILKLWR